MRDGVTETYVHLNGNARASDGGSGTDTNAAIFDFLTDRRGCECIHVEDCAISVDRLRANGMESFGDGLRAVFAVAQQIEVPRRSKRVGDPGYEQHRTLQDKAVAML
jgi:hypothetical protein